MENISWNDFEKIEMRVGTIIEVNDFPEARKPAYQLTIDFGTEIGTKNHRLKSQNATVKTIYKENRLLQS